jgi:protein ImuB
VLERVELPEDASGPQLERALELLLARVLARPERRGRALRALALSARLAGGGSWRERCVLRTPTVDPARIGLALGRKLAVLPAPAAALALEVDSFGPPVHSTERLFGGRDESRRARLGEAVAQARAAAGDSAALRVLEVDPDSRVPERRALLVPWVDAP